MFAIAADAAEPASEPVSDQGGASPTETASAALLGGDALSAGELAIASQISETVSTTEFLGPLAPVALSPFFGIAILSGISQFGPESMVASNPLLADDSPLQSPWVFGTFAGLALLTSLPRLTKVSKPIAGALDQIEAWSGIITMVTVKVLAGGAGGDELADSLAQPVAIAGIGTVTLDVALAIAAAVNIIVVNSVKFFFEFLIWITPVPFLDACFEAANKAVCAGLLGLYAFSPTVSLAVNAVVFVCCAAAFLWIHRQATFFRTMLGDWLLGWFRDVPEKAVGRKPLTVFPKAAFGPFSARERLRLLPTDDGYRLERVGLLRRSVSLDVTANGGRVQPGWLSHTLDLDDDSVGTLLFSRRYRRSLGRLAETMRLELAEEAQRTREQLKAELA